MNMAFLRFWHRREVSQCTSKRNLTGKTVVITGANTGLGYYTALDLAWRNARVILICRSAERGTEAVQQIIKETSNPNIVLKVADLSNLASVRKVAEEINVEEARLDILINNAGVSVKKKMITEDGFEYSFAANHLGPFLLTNLLLGLLRQSAPSRIVTVSSAAHKRGKIDFENLNSEKSFSGIFHTVYADAKLMNILFTKQLAKLLDGSGVTSNCLHPGVINTEIWRHFPSAAKVILFACDLLFFKTPVEGAQTTIHCAVCEKVDGVTGKYFSDCKEAEELLSPAALDEEVGKKLWEVSKKLTGLKRPG